MLFILVCPAYEGLRITKKFRTKKCTCIGWAIELATPGGNVYKLRIGEDSDGVCWLKLGWSEFALEHGIQKGDVLLFIPKEGSRFELRVFPQLCFELNFENYARPEVHETPLDFDKPNSTEAQHFTKKMKSSF